MPNLVDHQLRVAGVAMQICDAINGVEIDRDAIIKTCLLHDMGNIIKFNLDYFPEFLEPEGLEYWQKVKDEYIEKYGKDEHHATMQIAKELPVFNNVIEFINSIGFSQAEKNKEDNNFSIKICCYSDMRVRPEGIVLLSDRLNDLRNRYNSQRRSIDIKEKYLNRPSAVSENLRNIFEDSLKEIEKQIFSKCKIKPEDITDKSVALYIEKLKNFEI